MNCNPCHICKHELHHAVVLLARFADPLQVELNEAQGVAQDEHAELQKERKAIAVLEADLAAIERAYQDMEEQSSQEGATLRESLLKVPHTPPFLNVKGNCMSLVHTTSFSFTCQLFFHVAHRKRMHLPVMRR